MIGKLLCKKDRLQLQAPGQKGEAATCPRLPEELSGPYEIFTADEVVLRIFHILTCISQKIKMSAKSYACIKVSAEASVERTLPAGRLREASVPCLPYGFVPGGEAQERIESETRASFYV